MRGAEQPVTLRPARPEDATAIAEIWYRGWRDGHFGHVSEELVAIRTAESFQKRAGERIGDATVAVVDGVVAGFIMIADDEVEQMFVAAEHRGAGIADVLMEEAERQVKAKGHGRAWLAVVAGNARARRFYERNGWSDHGLFDYAAYTETGPIMVPTHRYVKDLC